MQSSVKGHYVIV